MNKGKKAKPKLDERTLRLQRLASPSFWQEMGREAAERAAQEAAEKTDTTASFSPKNPYRISPRWG